ncbi:MAG TPA: hypothetical protein PLW48_02560 [Alphaproteobacteria bacterium]|nr:hypothetical protein [Alphaproteobacteria bacterium]HCS24277.1 hypothetical protein [Rhodospirillaceae bacterium]HRI77879.1 hypothetical protein [Alphaproteobacteria bacterium]HRJ65992.1 hypothetical protein [Alphaproteobacteria bacterium]
MVFLRTLSKIFAALATGIFLYDLCYFWFVKNKFYIRPFKEFGDAVHKQYYLDFANTMKSFLPSWDKIAAYPAPVVFLAVAAGFYVLFKLIHVLRGGRGGDGFNYKSVD